MTAITLAAAQQALAAGVAEAERIGVAVSVAVLDAGGVSGAAVADDVACAEAARAALSATG